MSGSVPESALNAYGPTPYVHNIYAPESRWEQGVVGGGRAFDRYFPLIQAGTAGFYTKGPAHHKVRNGVRAGIDAMIFQYLIKKMDQANHWLKEKSPWYAEVSNKHPLLTSVVTGVAGFVAAVTGSSFLTGGLFNLLGGREVGWIQNGLALMEKNTLGKALMTGVSKLNGFMNLPAVKGSLAGALGLLLVGSIVKSVKDKGRFKREYKQARQQYPRKAVDPNTLRAAIMMHQQLSVANEWPSPRQSVKPTVKHQTALPSPQPLMELGPELDWIRQAFAMPLPEQSERMLVSAH